MDWLNNILEPSFLCYIGEGGDSAGSGGSSSPAGGGGNSSATTDTSSAAPSSSASPASSTPAAPAPASGSDNAASPGAASDPDPFDFSILSDGNDPFSPPPAATTAPGAASPPASPAAATPPGAPAAAPATPPAAAPAAPPAAAPAAAPAQPASPAPTAPPAASPSGANGGRPPLDPDDPLHLAQALRQNEQDSINHLASTVFKMSPEEVEALESNPADAVPKLLAKAMVVGQQAALTAFGQMMPKMMQKFTAQVKTNEENANAFYTRWPDIKKDVHGDLVNRYGVVYRQMHPNATKEQMIEDLGPMIMMAARIVPSTAPRPANGGPPPAAPQQPPKPMPGFVPAPSGGAAAADSNVVDNFWADNLVGPGGG